MKLKFLVLFFILLPHFYAKEIRYDYSFEELMNIQVVSTSFFEQSTLEAPGYIQRFNIDGDDFTQLMSLAELLEFYAVGSSVANHARSGSLHGVRGIIVDTSAKTLLMINGQQINPRSSFGSAFALNSPFLGDYQAVEVVNGPQAILHGSGAINGFVNLIPKSGVSHTGGFSSLTYGFKDDLKLLETGYGFLFNTYHDLYLYGAVVESKGYEPDNYYLAPREDYYTDAWDEDNFKLSSNWNYHDFNLQATFQKLNFSTNNVRSLATDSNPLSNTWLAVRPKILFDLSDTESLELSESFFLHDHYQELSAGGKRGARESHWTHSTIFRTTRIENHKLAIGATYGIKKFDPEAFFFSNSVGAVPFETLDGKWTEHSFFIEDIWELSDQLTLSFGLRYDKTEFSEIRTAFGDFPYNPNSFSELSPRINLSYRINDKHNLKVSYQHGFRTPDASNLSVYARHNDTASLAGARTIDLEPETMDSFEFNYSYTPSPKLQFDLNLYYNEYQDQLLFDDANNIWTDAELAAMRAIRGVPSNIIQNVSESIKTYGYELAAKYKLDELSHLHFSYGYVKTQGVDTQRYPSHIIKFNCHKGLSKKFALGFALLYNDSYSADEIEDRHYVFEESRTSLTVYANYKFTEKLLLNLKIENAYTSDVPRITGRTDEPNRGSLGNTDTKIYAKLTYQF